MFVAALAQLLILLLVMVAVLVLVATIVTVLMTLDMVNVPVGKLVDVFVIAEDVQALDLLLWNIKNG